MEEVVQYWIATAEHDRETMDVLFKSGRYSDSLFFGHIILEKVLKGLVVKKTKEIAPFIHDLTRLYELSGVDLDEQEIDLLDEVNDFNIRARYPEDKYKFYKQCTKAFTEKYLKIIEKLYKKLCKKAKSSI